MSGRWSNNAGKQLLDSTLEWPSEKQDDGVFSRGFFPLFLTGTSMMAAHLHHVQKIWAAVQEHLGKVAATEVCTKSRAVKQSGHGAEGGRDA